MSSPPTMDWSLGRYERTAAQLLPAATTVIDAAAPQAGEHVADVGCGSGNAALLAAERGARVTGIDPAQRLLEVARDRAAAKGLEASFVRGEAAAMPLADGAADVVLSVFGVIFAPDARAAAAEMTRVTAADGRVVLSAWIPEGAIAEAVAVARQAVMRALGVPAGAVPQFAWHDADALSGLFGPNGFGVELRQQSLAFTSGSAREYIDGEFQNHPLWVAGQALLEPRGEAGEVRDRALAILEAANEDSSGFRVTSRYVVVTARRV